MTQQHTGSIAQKDTTYQLGFDPPRITGIEPNHWPAVPERDKLITLTGINFKGREVGDGVLKAQIFVEVTTKNVY
jgi:hypothetical protein